MHSLRIIEIENPEMLRAEIEKIGADPEAFGSIAAGQIHRVVKIERAHVALARFLFQELTMEGGAAVMKPRMWHGGEGETDVLLLGTCEQLQHLAVRIATQPDEELQYLAQELGRALENF